MLELFICWKAMLFGAMVVTTPSLIILAWLLREATNKRQHRRPIGR